jgi:hypothetical protein
MFYSSMFIKSLQIGFVGLFLSVASVWAGPASIQGIVKDAKGQPIKGADVRVESRDGKQLFNTGVYRVSMVLNGAVKSSIMNTSTKADQATQLNFDLKPTVASPAGAGQAKGKHMVWMPASTGTHTGGRWVEVDENAAGGANALNVKRGSAEAVRQQQLHNDQGLRSLSGAVGNGSGN